MLNQARLKELVIYDPETGEFTLISSADRDCRRKVGSVLGGVTRQATTLDGHYCILSKLAFLYMTGEIPKHVEHINGNRRDNRWTNLQALDKKKPPPHKGGTWKFIGDLIHIPLPCGPMGSITLVEY
jgi:hypothetical protein